MSKRDVVLRPGWPHSARTGADLGRGRVGHYRRVFAARSPLCREVVAIGDAAAYVEQAGVGNRVGLDRPEQLWEHLGRRPRDLIGVKSNKSVLQQTNLNRLGVERDEP